MDNELMVKSIKELCKNNNITVSQLESELKFSPSLISRWKDKTPSIDKIVDIADYFHVTLDEVVGRTLKIDSMVSDEFINILYSMTEDKSIMWEDYTPQFSKYEDDEDFQIEDDGFMHKELFASPYQEGLFLLYCQYDEIKGVLSDFDIEIYIKPDSKSKAVLQMASDEKLLNLWLLVHENIYGTIDEIKANKFKNDFVRSQNDPIKKIENDQDALKQVYDQIKNAEPQLIEVVNKLNSPDMQNILKIISDSEFAKMMEQVNQIIEKVKDVPVR